MLRVDFGNPVYYKNPQNCEEHFSNFVEEATDYRSAKSYEVIDRQDNVAKPIIHQTPCWLTALRIAAIPLTLFIFPLLMLLAKAVLRASHEFQYQKPLLVGELVKVAPKFEGYKIGHGTKYEGITLTSMTIRPANLFFEALFGPDSTTMPGEGLFAFKKSHDAIRKQIMDMKPDDVVSFSAKGKSGMSYSRAEDEFIHKIEDLSTLYGDATYRISGRELQSTLESQKIYVSEHFPLPFYSALKEAMNKDKIVVLPGDDRDPVYVKDLESDACKALIEKVSANPISFGFESARDWDKLSRLTLYQLGSLVVKSEDYRIFLDSKGKMVERKPGEKDAIRLISACGIRGIHHTPDDPKGFLNRIIMGETFHTVIKAAGSGHLIVPAVGMGVWRGDPDLYWNAFLRAVIFSQEDLDQIYVNPRHQKTIVDSPYIGCKGEEFEVILNKYKETYPHKIDRLNKIVNLYDTETDVVHLANDLKKKYPYSTVSLLNASDPDVTMSNHVGEYVNNLDHATTTEENYTAEGTNGLCFEGITGVQKDPKRLIKVLTTFNEMT